jgi:hypothetical protein
MFHFVPLLLFGELSLNLSRTFDEPFESENEA